MRVFRDTDSCSSLSVYLFLIWHLIGPSGKDQCVSLVTIISFLILHCVRPFKVHSSCVLSSTITALITT